MSRSTYTDNVPLASAVLVNDKSRMVSQITHSEPKMYMSLPRSCTRPATWRREMSDLHISNVRRNPYLHPLRLPVSSNRFRCLQKMLDLRDACL